MILYTQRCLACYNKALWVQVKLYASKNDEAIEERRLTAAREYVDEARSYNMEVPFVVIKGEAKKIEDL